MYIVSNFNELKDSKLLSQKIKWSDTESAAIQMCDSDILDQVDEILASESESKGESKSEKALDKIRSLSLQVLSLKDNNNDSQVAIVRIGEKIYVNKKLDYSLGKAAEAPRLKLQALINALLLEATGQPLDILDCLANKDTSPVDWFDGQPIIARGDVDKKRTKAPAADDNNLL